MTLSQHRALRDHVTRQERMSRHRNYEPQQHDDDSLIEILGTIFAAACVIMLPIVIIFIAQALA